MIHRSTIFSFFFCFLSKILDKNEVNIKKNVNVKGIDTVFFKNKKKLPYNSKYSQSICMQNAMKLFDENYDCIIWSTADISIPQNLIDKIQSYRE